VGVDGRMDVAVEQLSGGETRRLELALAVLGRPEVLFLDEPTSGMDPVSRRRTWAVVDELRRGGTTVLLTNALSRGGRGARRRGRHPARRCRRRGVHRAREGAGVIRVLLADDEELIGVALAALLGLEDDLGVVAQASDGSAAVEAALAHRPDVAVVDPADARARRDGCGGGAVHRAPVVRGRDPDRSGQAPAPAGRAGRRREWLPPQGGARGHPGRGDPPGARGRALRRPGTGRRRAHRTAVPADPSRARRPASRRARHPGRPDRGSGAPVPWHRPQLPRRGRHQARRRHRAEAVRTAHEHG